MTVEKIGEDVTETICNALSLAIAEGALLPGTKIMDDVVAKHFGVSRTVARGAVAILERERVVERRRNHGAFVASPDKEQASQLLEARRTLELAIVSRAAETATEDDLDHLDYLIREEDEVHGGSDQAAKKRISGNFHVDLARIAGNEVMAEMLRNLVARLSLVSALYEKSGVRRCGTEDHRQILTAIRHRDADKAREAMLGHLLDIEATLDLSAPQDDKHSLSAVLAKFAPTKGKSAR